VLRGVVLGEVYGAFRADRGVCIAGFAVVSVDIYACPFCNITWYLSAKKIEDKPDAKATRVAKKIIPLSIYEQTNN